jgi:hypothetical protein
MTAARKQWLGTRMMMNNVLIKSKAPPGES